MSDQKNINNLTEQAKKAKISEVPAHKIMNKKVIVIHEGSKIYTAVATLSSHSISGAPVVDQKNQVVGVVTEHDLLLQTSTQDVSGPMKYTKKVISVLPETTIQELIILFFKEKVKWVPVVGQGKTIQGIVTRMDVLNRLIKQ